jgi:hypothetical protein
MLKGTGLIALFGASLVGLFGALPPALLATVAGTALLGSMAGAMGTALAADKERFAAAGTLAVTASGITLMGVGSAVWGALLRPSGAGRGTRAAPLTQTCVAAGTRHGQARFDLMGRPS